VGFKFGGAKLMILGKNQAVASVLKTQFLAILFTKWGFKTHQPSMLQTPRSCVLDNLPIFAILYMAELLTSRPARRNLQIKDLDLITARNAHSNLIYKHEKGI
jgi:hypothetical protein